MKKQYYTWQDVEHAADSIIVQMYKDLWMPDYIVGITRGGLPLATILSHRLDIRMETLKVKLRDIKEGESNETNCWMADDAFGLVDDRETYKSRWDPDRRKKILIVDDINDTGDTFAWIKQDWQSSCFANETHAWNAIWNKSVRFAVMTENLSSKFVTNYCWKKVNKTEDPVWLVYPYESDK